MSLRSAWFNVVVSTVNRIAFVVDAGAPAEFRGVVIEFLCGMLPRMPATMKKELRFLGNAKKYSPLLFPTQASAWFAENERRGRVIAPVMETIEADIDTVAIFSPSPVFDLYDWLQEVPNRLFVLVAREKPISTLPSSVEFVPWTEADSFLFSRLHDPIVRVDVVGPGFMPLNWTNRAYALTESNDGVRLTAVGADEYTIEFNGLVLDESPMAILQHSSSRQTIVTGDVIPGRQRQSAKLAAAEAERFRLAVAHNHFTCPFGGHDHEWNTVRCMRGNSILGRLVYPSLERIGSGFVSFNLDGDNVEYLVPPTQVIQIGPATVAIKKGGKGRIYQMKTNGMWDCTEQEIMPYTDLGDGQYVLLI